MGKSRKQCKRSYHKTTTIASIISSPSDTLIESPDTLLESPELITEEELRQFREIEESDLECNVKRMYIDRWKVFTDFVKLKTPSNVDEDILVEPDKKIIKAFFLSISKHKNGKNKGKRISTSYLKLYASALKYGYLSRNWNKPVVSNTTDRYIEGFLRGSAKNKEDGAIEGKRHLQMDEFKEVCGNISMESSSPVSDCESSELC